MSTLFFDSLLKSEQEHESASLDEMIRVGQNWRWMLATGIVFIVLGIMAFSMPVASTFGLTLGIAGLLTVGGIAQLVQAFKLRQHHGSAIRFIQSTLAMLVGVLMFRYPEGGMVGLAIMLSVYFLMSAMAQWILVSAQRPFKGRGWGYVGAIASFILGVYIIGTFPFSAMWVPGTLLGIDLVIGGCSLVALAFCFRDLYLHPSGRATFRPSQQMT